MGCRSRAGAPVLGALGLYALMGLLAPAHAQSAGPTPAPAGAGGQSGTPPPATAVAGGNTVDEVVVTTRRVEERLQDVPAAITALTAKQLEVLKPRTLQDLTGSAPNVQIGLVGAGAGAAAIYIRGLGYSDIEKGQNPSVGLLIDDVVIGTNTAQLVDAFDVTQVEIDRGPQGIFFGKNTTAGAISIHRSRPTHKWGVSVSGAYGSYNTNIERIILNAPIGDKAGLKIGVSHRSRDGYLNNITTGNDHYGRDELTTANIELDLDVTPRFNILASVDVTHQNGEGTPVSLGDSATAAVFGPLLAPAGIRFNQYGSPFIPGKTRALNPYEVANDFPDRNLLTQERLSLNATLDTDIGKFYSITAFINQRDDAEQDFDGSCGVANLTGSCQVIANPLLPFLHTSRPQDYQQFTQEIRFTHNFGDRVRFMTGFYFFHHEIGALQLTRTAVPGVPVTEPFIQQLSGETNNSFSGFANLDVDLTSKLSVSAGLRYIYETKDFFNGFNILYVPGVGRATNPIPLVPQFNRSASYDQPITRFSVNYKLLPDSMLYASRSEGFRSGGFSPRSTLSESQPGQSNYSPGADYSAFGPETDVAYEVGSKNSFFNRQLTLNVAGFYTEDTGFEQSFVVVTPGFGPGTNTYITNLGKVEIKGVELEAIFHPDFIRGLTVSGSYGYQDAKIVDGKVPGVEAPVNADATAGKPGSTYDVSGTTLARVPKNTFSVRADYTFPLFQGDVEINAGYKWNDDFVFARIANVEDTQKAFGLLDASLSYSWSKYRISISGKNLTNEVYLQNTLPSVFFQGWAEPRTFLAEVQARF